MPTVKKTSAVFKTHFIDMAVFGIPFLAGFGYTFWSHQLRMDVFIACIVVIGVAFIRQQRRFRRFVCPNCGSVLRRKPAHDGSPVTFECTPCDTIWDTGFIDSAGD